VSEILGTGLAFPLGVDERGRIALVGDVLDVEQAMLLIMDTTPGERPMRPDFGCAVHDSVFERVDPEATGRIEHAVREALDRWEPRVVVETVEFDTPEQGVLLIDVRYRVKTTNDVRNLVYPFYVIPEDER
jgi:phage baseplate assembly protein W